MNEQEFYTQIKQRTGLKLGIDFGFVAGTHLPYSDLALGFQPSGRFPGYMVWRNYRDDLDRLSTAEKIFPDEGIEKNLKNIIEFLNTPASYYKKYENRVFEAIGEASMCWNPKPYTNVFDSTHAKDVGERLLSDLKKDIPLAIDILTEALKDPMYKQAWVANIAMAFMDEMDESISLNYEALKLGLITLPTREQFHGIANRAAERFIQLLIR